MPNAARTISLTPNEIRVLLLILGVDLDALGLDTKDHSTVRSVVRKLKEPASAQRS